MLRLPSVKNKVRQTLTTEEYISVGVDFGLDVDFGLALPSFLNRAQTDLQTQDLLGLGFPVLLRLIFQ